MDTDRVATAVHDALQNDSVTELDYFEARECTSKDYEGVELTVGGYVVQIRPMIDAVAHLDDWRIGNIGLYAEGYPVEDDDGETTFEDGVSMFCAYVGDDLPDNDFFI